MKVVNALLTQQVQSSEPPLGLTSAGSFVV